VGDSGGNNEGRWRNSPVTVLSTSYYDFWKPKFADFFRPNLNSLASIVLQAKKTAVHALAKNGG
jgi:hypothetical protein